MRLTIPWAAGLDERGRRPRSASRPRSPLRGARVEGLVKIRRLQAGQSRDERHSRLVEVSSSRGAPEAAHFASAGASSGGLLRRRRGSRAAQRSDGSDDGGGGSGERARMSAAPGRGGGRYMIRASPWTASVGDLDPAASSNYMIERNSSTDQRRCRHEGRCREIQTMFAFGAHFAEIVSRHARIVVGDDGGEHAFCVYGAPTEEIDPRARRGIQVATRYTDSTSCSTTSPPFVRRTRRACQAPLAARTNGRRARASSARRR